MNLWGCGGKAPKRKSIFKKSLISLKNHVCAIDCLGCLEFSLQFHSMVWTLGLWGGNPRRERGWYIKVICAIRNAASSEAVVYREGLISGEPHCPRGHAGPGLEGRNQAPGHDLPLITELQMVEKTFSPWATDHRALRGAVLPCGLQAPALPAPPSASFSLAGNARTLFSEGTNCSRHKIVPEKIYFPGWLIVLCVFSALRFLCFQ